MYAIIFKSFVHQSVTYQYTKAHNLNIHRGGWYDTNT